MAGGETLDGLSTHHGSVPHHRHPLFNPIGSFWDQSEVVLPDGLLRCGEASVSAGGHLEVSAAVAHVRGSVTRRACDRTGS